ncbi:hypothetical protein [Pseudomonas syringae]|uniref:hypothetical protein n=1 Tax=Pseudomonas syringae TaxID=317 RepID=UPI00273FF171|nr:hypothetical protein [Pseudomonas syringae]MDP5168553.1 hypothetical protein [Pseudomonas syringae pv. aptata str. DSM 50252]
MSKPVACIQINGIEVGSLPLELYNSIVDLVRKDRRLYVAYVFQGLWLFLRVAAAATVATPSAVLIMFAFLVAVDPTSFTEFVVQLRDSTPEQITSALRQLLYLGWVLGMVFLPVYLIVVRPKKFAFNNPFEAAISRRIRSMLEVPTEGTLSVFIVDNDLQSAG